MCVCFVCIFRPFLHYSTYQTVCLSVCLSVCMSLCVCTKDRSTFRRIVLKNAFNKRKMYETLLESVPMLNTLDVRSRLTFTTQSLSPLYQSRLSLNALRLLANCESYCITLRWLQQRSPYKIPSHTVATGAFSAVQA